MKIILNIGLENNPFGFDSSLAVVKSLLHLKHETVGYTCSQYNGETERTLIVEAHTTIQSTEIIISQVEKIAGLLEQECIPFFTEGSAELVYDTSYEGEKHQFDPDYFEILR